MVGCESGGVYPRYRRCCYATSSIRAHAFHATQLASNSALAISSVATLFEVTTLLRVAYRASLC
jgi:hypothetical protein